MMYLHFESCGKDRDGEDADPSLMRAATTLGDGMSRAHCYFLNTPPAVDV